MKKVFPREILENTAEVHKFKHSTGSKVIYLLILLILIGAFIALPFIKIDVISQARGIIKPDIERVHISLINSGQVIYNGLFNNKKVAKGDTLLILNDQGIDQKLAFSDFQTREKLAYIQDLSLLLRQKKVRLSDINSARYQKSYLQYHQKLDELQIRLQKRKRDFERYKPLYEKGVIARAEYDNHKFEYDLAKSEIFQHRNRQQNEWQAELSQYNITLKELQAKYDQLVESKSRFVITAPVSGTLLNIKQQETGSFVIAGTVLAQISPNTELLVECYVSPADIGLIKEQDTAKYQIDAYDYSQWGLASGKVVEIGKDIEFLEDQSVFKVRCSLDQKYLLLKNGFRGNLKKGMTLNANFRLSRRTLFELLYDKMNNWLDPASNSLAHQ
ncbi:HlyD family efflux transporter periplasmic adaptor subunit [uncultured Eudoraea sp.]|uniref:HlyD family secretion protein n=1 Tax=uncultured Eudoraea sp. TaxID=1035614 RepID=UPI0026335A46|nr:HlyD family efflux transporter periplasmic adaptor subunit [uncultured Eudoraea sp.]